MRARNKLSVKDVQNAKEPGRYGDGGGLELQVSKWLTRSWIFRYSRNGKTRWLGLGPYPDVSLSDARDAAEEQRKLLRTGVDPIEARNERRAARAVEAAKTLTFKQCTEKYIAAHKASWKSEKHADQWRMTLLGVDAKGQPAKNDYCKIIHDLPVAAIDVALVLKVIEPMWGTKTETASRVRGRIETILSWAKARGFRSGENPAIWRGHLDQLLPARSQVAPVEHHAALPYRDMPAFMAKLRAKMGISARALEFTILTAARTGDTIGGKWSEIDHAEELWIVPKERVKGKKGARKRDHVVPLSKQAMAILEDLPREADFIFPGGVEDCGLSSAAMDQLLKGMGYDSNVATVHGFRSTFKDWAMEQTAYSDDLSELALAHTIKDKVKAAYHRGDMLEKRRRLMADWAWVCEQHVMAPVHPNVTGIREARIG